MENDDKTIIELFQKSTPSSKDSSSKSHNHKKSSQLRKGSIAGIGVGAVVVGAAGAAIPFYAYGGNFHNTNNQATDSKNTQDQSEDLNETTSDTPTSHFAVVSDLPVATCVTDDMTPSEAFAAAREEVGPGGIYYYHGQAQGTYYETEWNNMSQIEKEDYWASVQHTHAHHEYATHEVTDQSELELIDAVEVPAIYIVDHNGNIIDDAIMDIDNDGIGDVLMVDIEVEDGEVVTIGETHFGSFNLDQWASQSNIEYEENDNVNDDDIYSDDININDDDDLVYNDYDYTANMDLDDDIFIENNIDTTDMI